MDIDKIKSFLVSHFEKFLLGGIVAGSGFLVYQGTQLPDFTDEKTPEQLSQQANTVKLGIDDDHTAEIITERKPIPGDSIVARTKQLYKAVDPTTYKLSKIWVGEVSGDSVIRRQDPLLLPPIDLRTIGVICAMAANGAREMEGYPLAQLEDADDLKPEEMRRPRGRKPRGRRGMDEMDDGMGDDMMDMMGHGGQDDAGLTKILSPCPIVVLILPKVSVTCQVLPALQRITPITRNPRSVGSLRAPRCCRTVKSTRLMNWR